MGVCGSILLKITSYIFHIYLPTISSVERIPNRKRSTKSSMTLPFPNNSNASMTCSPKTHRACLLNKNIEICIDKIRMINLNAAINRILMNENRLSFMECKAARPKPGISEGKYHKCFDIEINLNGAIALGPPLSGVLCSPLNMTLLNHQSNVVGSSP